MAITPLTVTIDLNPSYKKIPAVYVSQLDNNLRSLAITVQDGGVNYDVASSGYDVYVEGTKPDKHGFSYKVTDIGGTVVGSVVTVPMQTQMTCVQGMVPTEIVLKSGADRIGSANFLLVVERAGLAEDVDVSETDIPAYINGAQQAAAAALQSAEDAEQAKDTAVEAAETAQQVKDSIPADYTTLSNDVTDLKNAIQPISAVSTIVVDGYIAALDGELKAPTSDAEKTTDFIPATYGSHIDVLTTLTSAQYRYCSIYTYDINKAYITRLANVEGGSFSSFKLSADVTDDKVRFVRITVKAFNAFSSIAVNTYSSIGEALKYVYSTYADLINKVDGEHGKNLFDKTGIHTAITKGQYRGYWSGGWAANADYEVAMYAVTDGEMYAVNTNNTHICFFSDSAGKVYIGGFLANQSNGFAFTTPDNALSMSVSFMISAEDSFQIEKGTAPTAYEAFKWGVSNNNIIGSPTVYNVGTDKLYKTIQSAVNVAKNNDIIMIDAGTYNESVDMVGKELHLIGSGRDSTIVQCAGDDYYYPALEASRGLIENMSFITTATQKADGAIDTAYSVHIDFDDEAGHALQFVNCYFQSPIRPTVGIGLRENFTLNFTDCKFKSSVYPVYCHEQQANNITGQRIELINCSVQCTGAMSAIHLQESRAYTGNEVTILMQRCIAKANGVSGNNIISAVTYPNNQQPTGSNYLNLNSFYLDTMSALNNETILNA